MDEAKDGTPADGEVKFQAPPKVTTYRPIGVGVENNGNGVDIGFLISPFEFAEVKLMPEGLANLLLQIEGEVGAEAMAALIAEAKAKQSGIAVVKNNIVVPS